MSFDSWCLLHLDELTRRLAAHYQAHLRIVLRAEQRQRRGVWIVEDDSSWE